jgi:hypothetical protein
MRRLKLSSGQLHDLNFRYRQEINFYSYRLAKRITLPQNREVIASKLVLKNDNPDWEEGLWFSSSHKAKSRIVN